MTPRRVLVAYASQSGSTAAVAQAIERELRRAALEVDRLQASEVEALEPYDAVILGSGVFLAHRGCDGGGFLTRHATELDGRRVWLFTAGPIGRRHAEASDGGVIEVARAIGAAGAATFGSADPTTDGDDLAHLRPVDLARVRAWARAIARELGSAAGTPAPGAVAAVSAC
jgi:menaquinone-dependent protoporphyrinogen oxidase